MLPTKVFQLDYQDFGNLVNNDIEKIKNFLNTNFLHKPYDCVLSKLRNGMVPGSIVATTLNLPLGVIEAPRGSPITDFKVFFPTGMSDSAHVLLVDSICGTGQTIKDLVDFLKSVKPGLTITSYCTLVDERAKIKPNICGTLEKRFIQPPWEWKSFTPQSHLARLENGSTKAADEKDFFIGFSSQNCRDNVESITGKLISNDWTTVFVNFADDKNLVQAPSKISSFTIDKNAPVSLQSYRTKFKKLIDEKVDFILSNGVSHYVEDNLEEAILLSQECPVTHIVYFDGHQLHKINAKKITCDFLDNLN